MKRIVLMSILALLLLPAIAVFASDVSDARYITELVATNSAVITKTNVISTVNLTSQDMVDSGMVADTVDDAALLKTGAVDMPLMPGYDTNPWMIFINSIPFLSSENYYLYSGDATGGKIVYFPDTAGMTTPSIAGLGDNFTVTLSDVWIDTTAGAGKYIFYKTGAILIYIDSSTSNKVTLQMSAAANLSPTSYTDVSGTWLNETLIYDGDTGTFGYANIADGAWSDYIILTRAQVYTDTISIDWRNNPNIDNSDIDVYYSSAWHDLYDGNIASDTWVDYAIGSIELVTQVRVKLHRTGGAVPCIDELVFQRETESNINLTSIVSGEYDITITADRDSNLLTFDVGGSSDTTTLYNGVIDNANDIISFENDTVLYAGSQEIEVDGVQKQFVDWDYGTTFTDQSGNGNHATPTFRTTSSDADVSAVFMDFQPYDTADIGEYSIESESYMITTTPDAPDDLFDTTAEGDVDVPDTLLPGLFNPLLQTATIPVSFFWIMVAFCTAMAGGLIAYGGVTKLRDQSASFASADSFALFIQALVSGVILVIWITATGGTVIPAWIMAPYVIIELAAILLVRRGVA